MIGFELLMFCLGLVLLIWGSSLFVDSAVTLAKYLHLSEVLIGATIVSIGTTMPETLFSTLSAIRGLPEMALGNALGSILCNTGLIAGFLLLLKPVLLTPAEVQNIVSGSFTLGIGFFIYFLSGLAFDGLSRSVGLFLIFACVMYLRNIIAKPDLSDSQTMKHCQTFTFSDTIRLIMEMIAVYIGASLLVKSGPLLARSLGVPEVIISLILVALGTSLPELVTSIVSLTKKHASLSLGNIIGANILNFLLVGGISSSIRPIKYSPTVMKLELPFIFLLLFLLCVPSILQKKAGRFQGVLLLFGYALYLFLLMHVT